MLEWWDDLKVGVAFCGGWHLLLWPLLLLLGLAGWLIAYTFMCSGMLFPSVSNVFKGVLLGGSMLVLFVASLTSLLYMMLNL